MRSSKGFNVVCLILFLLLSACSNEGNAEGEESAIYYLPEGQSQMIQ